MSQVKANSYYDASGGSAAQLYGVSMRNGGTAWVNRIINGNFDVWQRGTSFTLSSGAQYTADRWQVGGATGSVSRQTFTLGQTDVPGNPTYYAQWVLSSNSQNYEFVQKIEGVRSLAGQATTVSFYARRTSGSVTLSPRIVQYFGTGGSPSSTSVTGLGSMTLTTSWQRFTFNVTVPSISGKTIGTNNDDSLWLSFQVADTNTGTIEFAQIQFEDGTVASPFERRDYGRELIMCQRYYYMIRANSGSGSYTKYGLGYASSTVNFVALINLPVTMRAAPTTLDYGTISWYNVYDGVVNITATGFGVDQASPNTVSINMSASGGGLTQARPGALQANATTSGYLGLGAEL